nr:MAG TPA: hypothetical protein [Caudoviricetes sp.]
MSCQQWQSFAYTRTEALQTFLASDDKTLSTEHRKRLWHGSTEL